MACNPCPRDTDAALLQGQSSERWLTAYRRCLAERGRPARRGLPHTGAIFCRTASGLSHNLSQKVPDQRHTSATALALVAPRVRSMPQIGGVSRHGIERSLAQRARLVPVFQLAIRAAAARGRKGGRQPKLTPEQKTEILEGLGSGRKSAADLARLFRVHRTTISRLAAQARATSGESPAA
jgi:hypothetical protein